MTFARQIENQHLWSFVLIKQHAMNIWKLIEFGQCTDCLII